MKQTNIRKNKETKKRLLIKCVLAAIAIFLVVVLVNRLLNENENNKEIEILNEKHNVEIGIFDKEERGLNGIHVCLKHKNGTSEHGNTDYYDLNCKNGSLIGKCNRRNKEFQATYIVMDRNNDNKIDRSDVVVYANSKIIEVESIDENIIKLKSAPKENTELTIDYIGRGNPGYIFFQDLGTGIYEIYVDNNLYGRIQVVSDSCYNIEYGSEGGEK